MDWIVGQEIEVPSASQHSGGVVEHALRRFDVMGHFIRKDRIQLRRLGVHAN
jgi:hypothetical protein